jgi:hypothetical protein
MKKVFSVLALIVSSSKIQAFFADQLRIESAQINLKTQSLSLTRRFIIKLVGEQYVMILTST